MRGAGRIFFIFISISIFFSLFINFSTAAKPKIVLLANDIDFGLAGDLFGFLENRGIETVRATADDFEQYKGSERFIVILGGPDAYDGVGNIVREIITPLEEDDIRKKGSLRMLVKIDPWGQLSGQRVTILAGSDRNHTKKAHQENRGKVAAGTEEEPGPEPAPPQILINIEGFAFSPSILTVEKGSTIGWTNKDSVSHTTTALDGTWDSGIMRKGHSFSQG
jgi:plastocyanin